MTEEELKAYRKSYWKKNREKLLAYGREYRAKNRQRLNLQYRIKYSTNAAFRKKELKRKELYRKAKYNG